MNRTFVAEPPKKAPPQELSEVVECPRAAFTEDVWSRPFSEVKAMAERGERGMRIQHVPTVVRNTLGNGKYAYQLRREDEDGKEYVQNVQVPDDVCYLRLGEAEGDKDHTFLYAQNW